MGPQFCNRRRCTQVQPPKEWGSSSPSGACNTLWAPKFPEAGQANLPDNSGFWPRGPMQTDYFPTDKTVLFLLLLFSTFSINRENHRGREGSFTKTQTHTKSSVAPWSLLTFPWDDDKQPNTFCFCCFLFFKCSQQCLFVHLYHDTVEFVPNLFRTVGDHKVTHVAWHFQISIISRSTVLYKNLIFTLGIFPTVVLSTLYLVSSVKSLFCFFRLSRHLSPTSSYSVRITCLPDTLFLVSRDILYPLPGAHYSYSLSHSQKPKSYFSVLIYVTRWSYPISPFHFQI